MAPHKLEQTGDNSAQVSAAIRMRGVDKSYSSGGRTVDVLKDIHLRVAAGSIVGVIGSSGSGKSTLLKIIAGIVKPDRGEICIDGATGEPACKWGSVSYMLQDDGLLPWRTAGGNVELALEAHSMADEERARRVLEALRVAGFEGSEAAFPYRLSGGMRSRVALARSLVTEPRVLLMDEPFSRLDARTRGVMHSELLRIHRLKGLTVVFVTHDIAEAVLLADQVVVLSGRPGIVREIVDIAPARPRDLVQMEVTSYMQRLRSLV